MISCAGVGKGCLADIKDKLFLSEANKGTQSGHHIESCSQSEVAARRAFDQSRSLRAHLESSKETTGADATYTPNTHKHKAPYFTLGCG